MIDLKNNKIPSLTYSQREWLNQCGGRDESDVMIDEKGFLYIEMVKGKDKVEKVILPKR